MKFTIELNENEVKELKDLIFGDKNRSRKDYRLTTTFDDRWSYEKFMGSMLEIAHLYSIFTVADFKDIAGIEANYTDNKYGWSYKQLVDVHANRGCDGKYILTMPKHYPL